MGGGVDVFLFTTYLGRYRRLTDNESSKHIVIYITGYPTSTSHPTLLGPSIRDIIIDIFIILPKTDTNHYDNISGGGREKIKSTD